MAHSPTRNEVEKCEGRLCKAPVDRTQARGKHRETNVQEKRR